jgi:hypothetical protein
MKNPVVESNYNLFQEGRVYGANHRDYILEAARNVARADITQEGIRLRELYGYYGHGYRELTGKLKLEEIERVRMPDGTWAVFECVPSNVCRGIDVGDNGDVRHSQEFLLANRPGQIAYGLHKDRIGGFSWATDLDRFVLASTGKTKVTRLYGWDYVTKPNFVKDKGFALESAEQADFLLEVVAKAANLSDQEARERVNGWIFLESLRVDNLSNQLEDAMAMESALRAERDETADALESARAENERLKAAEKARREAVLEGSGKTVVAIPDDVQHALMNLESANDFERVVGFFETAGRVDLGMIVPKDAHGRKREIYVTPPDKYHPAEDDEYRNGMRLNGSLFLD